MKHGRSTLFDGTQAKAGLVAARCSGGRTSYPDSLLIDGQPFTRAPIAADEPPGVPYARGSAAGAGGGLVWRVGLVECEGCGRPLKMVVEAAKKTFRCGVPGCNRVWHLLIVREPGGVELLAMVLKTV